MTKFTKDNCDLNIRNTNILSIDYVKEIYYAVTYEEGPYPRVALFDSSGNGVERRDNKLKLILKPVKGYIVICRDEPGSCTYALSGESCKTEEEAAQRHAKFISATNPVAGHMTQIIEIDENNWTEYDG